MSFGGNLSKLLEARHISIAEASRLTGVHDSTLRSIISRNSNDVAMSVAIKISRGLNISIDEINGWGRSDTPAEEVAAVHLLDKRQAGLLQDFSRLSQEDQEQIESMIHFLIKKNEKR